MPTPAPKPTFGFNYWLGQLVLLGQQRQGLTYTPADVQKLRTHWQNQPLTKLHQQVRYRQCQAAALAAIPPLGGQGAAAGC